MSEWVCISEAASELGVSYKTLRRAVMDGKVPEDAVMEIPGSSDKGIIRVDLDALKEMCKENFREKRKKPGRPLSTRFTEGES